MILAAKLVTKPVKIFVQVRLGYKFLTHRDLCHVDGVSS